MMDDDINMGQWNVCGLRDSNRCRAIRKWVNMLRYPLTALCLQEVKTTKDRALFQLKTIFLNGRFMVDTNSRGRVGATIALPMGLPMLDAGYKGDGSFAWIKTRTDKGIIFIGSIYGSYKRP